MKVLVLHALQENSRRTNVEFSGSFARHHFGNQIHYLNILGVRASLPEPLGDYDLAIVTYEVLAHRDWVFWGDLQRRIIRLTSTAKQTVLLPQDDYVFPERLDNLTRWLTSPVIFSPLSKDLEKIYPKSMASGVTIYPCLTGYFEDSAFQDMIRFSKPYGERQIDLGQRVSEVPLHFGIGGMRKTYIAKRMASEFSARGYEVNVSTRREDAFLGNAWLSFLGDTKVTVSRKGGSSVVDKRNKLRFRLALLGLVPFLTDARRLKLASFGVAEPGDFSAESPRLFEAAALGTVQILEEDTYLGGLFQPWKHYLPLASDFSNLDEIFQFMSDPSMMSEVATSARSLLLESRAFSYAGFVSEVFAQGNHRRHISDDETGSVVDLDEDKLMAQSEPNHSLHELRRFLSNPQKLEYLKDPRSRDRFSGLMQLFCSVEHFPESAFLPWVSFTGASEALD